MKYHQNRVYYTSTTHATHAQTTKNQHGTQNSNRTHRTFKGSQVDVHTDREQKGEHTYTCIALTARLTHKGENLYQETNEFRTNRTQPTREIEGRWLHPRCFPFQGKTATPTTETRTRKTQRKTHTKNGTRNISLERTPEKE